MTASFLAGGGEMGDLIRRLDWSATPIGAVSSWPQSLKTAVGILLSSGYPMYIAWGQQFTQLYNDAYRPILGSTKHPAALGISTIETFREIWDFIGPMFREVLETGRASTFTDQLLLLERHGFKEECYFTFSYSAIPDDFGGIGGVFVTVIETTERVIRERRLGVLRDLMENRSGDDIRSIAQGSAQALSRDAADLPFVLFVEPRQGGECEVLSHAGLEKEELARVIAQASAVNAKAGVGLPAVVKLEGLMVADAARPEGVTDAVCVGVAAPGRTAPQVVLIAGLSPRLRFAAEYEEFLRAVAANVGIVIAEAEALGHEKRRAEALAEIDRAKTVFFSDVSHEFRTPLALMMGPIDEAIAQSSDEVRENLLIAKRNTVRLLKLVNSLLDFSRIEAGRMQARYERLDLSRFTADLASNFRSAVERAGLQFVVDCPTLSNAISVDPTMWEKIVLNLVSNAFKHTFEGSITVRLREDGGQVRLEVSDTGVGIPAEQATEIFERFRRVPNARSRTHEGSGIGLALVRELARMHGGDVTVESREGHGSVFTVSVLNDIRGSDTPESGMPRAEARSLVASSYVEEAMRWLPDDRHPEAAAEAPHPSDGMESSKVLIVDDNADMREYLRRLVSQRWLVKCCPDGLSALVMAEAWQPDLIISDVMMPQLDGFELIQRLRQNSATAGIPIILLSARAGEDARIDGVRAGAVDYLVKPFTSRDLYARVESQLLRSRMHKAERETALGLARLFEQAPLPIALLRGPTFVYEIANQSYRELVARDDLLWKPIREALPELEGQGIYELLEQVYTTQIPYVGNLRPVTLNRRGSEQGWFNFVFQPIVDLQGQTEAILVVAYEVTELAKAKRAAESANFAKDEFLAMLGHELRNPLSPILTVLQIMRMKGGVGGDKERSIIERQVKHLMSLVDDLLDVSRVTQGKIALVRQRVELADVVARAVEQAGPLLEERQHHLAVDVPAGTAVDGDEQRLAQVMTNLLTNAAKFTGNGGHISISAKQEDGNAVVIVRDDGIGISADKLPQVFDLFFQAQKSFDRSHGGLGLGLAIVRNLVSLHGGSVSARSEGPGKGSEFTLRLPLSLAETQAVHSQGSDANDLEGKRILIVDDNRDAAETLADMVRLKGHTAHVAHDAASALTAAAEFKPDIAYLDLGLPAISGYDLAQQLQSLSRGRDLPLFAVTGYGQREDRERSRVAGFRGHLVKPVSIEEIEASLRNAFHAK